MDSRASGVVALSIGIDQAQYSRIESGKVEPTLSSIEKITEALHIEVVHLFSKEEPKDINSYDKNIVEKNTTTRPARRSRKKINLQYHRYVYH